MCKYTEEWLNQVDLASTLLHSYLFCFQHRMSVSIIHQKVLAWLSSPHCLEAGRRVQDDVKTRQTQEGRTNRCFFFFSCDQATSAARGIAHGAKFVWQR